MGASDRDDSRGMVVTVRKERDYNPRPPRTDAQSGQEMRNMNRKHKKWTKADERRLLHMANQKCSRRTIARRLGRTESSCDARLHLLRKKRKKAALENPKPTERRLPPKKEVAHRAGQRTDSKPSISKDDMINAVNDLIKRDAKNRIVIKQTIEQMEDLLNGLRRLL